MSSTGKLSKTKMRQEGEPYPIMFGATLVTSPIWIPSYVFVLAVQGQNIYLPSISGETGFNDVDGECDMTRTCARCDGNEHKVSHIWGELTHR